MQKSIFVDVTTGEVVGGADESYWEEKRLDVMSNL